MKTRPVVLFLLLGLVSGVTAANRRTPVVEAVEKALPSVVNIGTEKLVKVRYTDPLRRFRGDLFDKFFSDFFGQSMSPGYRVAHSLGSGVIIDPSGYILSNYHVIERASKIRVTLADETAYDARFLAGDELNDLALIKIDPEEPLKAVEFAKGDDLLLGETVIVLGNPFGLSQTVTVGVLSSKSREARYEGQVLYRDILQTDAAVNPGSSGGPLLNIDGELIGINVAIYREAQNIGFAVPVARARALVAEWLSPRHVARLWTGFEPEAKDGALVVGEVDEGSPAAKAGLRPADVVRRVGAAAVKDLFEFNRTLLGLGEGDRVVLGVERGGAEEEVALRLAALPKASGGELAERTLGLLFTTEKPAAVENQPQLSKGLAVADVVKDGAAEKAGLRAGLLVTRINDTDIGTLDDVAIALERVKPGDKVLVGLLSLEESGSFIVAQSSSVQLTAE